MSESTLEILGSEEATAGLPFANLISALETGFAAGCEMPVRHHHNMKKSGEPDATLLLMPAWSLANDPEQFLGVKLVTVVPGNTGRNLPGLTSTYILYDGVTGRQLALMDGNTITGRRTVATSALAARYLSRPDASSLLVLGAGRVASLIPDAYLAVRDIKTIRIWDINPESSERFASSLRARGLDALAVTDLEAAVSTADIVSAATLSTAPLILGEWVRPGTHIDLIGGFTPGMREADDKAVAISRVFVDTEEALHEAGDIVQPIKLGAVDREHVIGTLADLVSGKQEGRRSTTEVTYFKAVGSALADLVAAKLLYQASRSKTSSQP